MEMGHFNMKILKFSNRIIFDMHVGYGKIIKLHCGTSINNSQMKLKFNFGRCYVSVEQNAFKFYWTII